MLTPDAIQRASDHLWQAWQAGRVMASLPGDMRPSTRSEGYAIQARLEARTSQPLFGWKIAATSAAGQTHINVKGPMAGRILAERVVANGATVSLANNRMRVAEPEFAFRMGRTLAPRATPYGVEEVMAAVASLHPAIEVPDSRFEDFTAVGEAQLIADDACAHLFMLGDAAPDDWRNLDLAIYPVACSVAGKLDCEGSGANVLGDPRIALAWIANELSALGIGLKAGEVVTTGTCVKPLEVGPGDAASADYGRLGRVSLSFS
jgi:2-keto-4-pentenoate hydratase